MNIGNASRESGVSAKMIRYYEQIGLLTPAKRSDAGYRLYSPDEIHALRFIRQARRLGFPVDDIRKLLALWQDRSRASAEVKSIAIDHVAELDERISELTNIRNTLADLAAHCNGEERTECPILASLADVTGDPE